MRCRDRLLPLDMPVVMGILNVTPDSFSDGGLHFDRAAAITAGLRMATEGAAIIDVGGESTRPGAAPVDAQQEIDRVVPVIEALASRVDVLLSVDTSKPAVITAALRAGAHMVNDIRALRMPGALDAAAAEDAGVCVMHMQGEPATMQVAPHYQDVVAEVHAFLAERVAACKAAGIAQDSICVDPGIGFGKTYEHNLTLLRNQRSFTDLGCPVLIGVSRKSLIGIMTGRAASERVVGSAVAAAFAVAAGAAIIRAHDVPATVDAVRVALALRASGEEREAR
ncbi:MAG: dihydropteroate synthase [Gammaproteobacteria bacterium]|nr:dihydropteroate synthase [Gammaproteobacteria bacterium]